MWRVCVLNSYNWQQLSEHVGDDARFDILTIMFIIVSLKYTVSILRDVFFLLTIVQLRIQIILKMSKTDYLCQDRHFTTSNCTRAVVPNDVAHEFISFGMFIHPSDSIDQSKVQSNVMNQVVTYATFWNCSPTDGQIHIYLTGMESVFNIVNLKTTHCVLHRNHSVLSHCKMSLGVEFRQATYLHLSLCWENLLCSS